jgi:aspartyl-tRNA(Asn)/glutamyl-tRNA(Gln) amidotransferase subunit C
MAEEKITKETLDNLLKLSRMEFAEGERGAKEKKLIKDLQNILDHFSTLQEVDTKNVEVVSGGKAGKNEYREDVVIEAFQPEDSKVQFPDTANGYLKVPAILEHKKKK